MTHSNHIEMASHEIQPSHPMENDYSSLNGELSYIITLNFALATP